MTSKENLLQFTTQNWMVLSCGTKNVKVQKQNIEKKGLRKKTKKKQRIRVVPKRKVFQPLFVQGAIS